MFQLIKTGLVVVLALYLFGGCYPKGPEYYSDLDLTVTDRDPDYNFGSQKMYWMADTVEYITNIEDNEIDPGDVEKLLAEVESNLAAKGYDRLDVNNPNNAEFVITVSVIASRNTGVGWVPGPPCYPGWGWGCYPGYYPPYWGGYYTYSYTTGSVIINWYDPQEPPIDNNGKQEQPIHWVATFNGLVSSSKENNAARIAAGIEQAFNQSDYIKSNL